MIRGDIEKNIFSRSHDLVLYDEEKEVAYTFEIKEHKLDENDSCPVTKFKYGGSNHDKILHGFAEALQKIGLIPKSATDAELKATKYHLEDMRKQVFKYEE